MPNTKAAKKALRQSERKRVHNLRKKRGLAATIKSYKKAIQAGETDEARKQLPMVFKKLDKAAKTNIIKSNKASRLKSRLSKKLEGGAPSTPKQDQAPTQEQ